jgi:hypothetical protein
MMLQEEYRVVEEQFRSIGDLDLLAYYFEYNDKE